MKDRAINFEEKSEVHKFQNSLDQCTLADIMIVLNHGFCSHNHVNFSPIKSPEASQSINWIV